MVMDNAIGIDRCVRGWGTHQLIKTTPILGVVFLMQGIIEIVVLVIKHNYLLLINNLLFNNKLFINNKYGVFKTHF